MRPSGTPPYWSAGTEILWRYQRRGSGPASPESVRPMRVVRDDPAALVAWLAPGTPVLRPVLADGRELRDAPPSQMFLAPRAIGRSSWRGSGILKIAPTGTAWSVWHFWEPDWTFRGWYVNLEDPHQRDADSIYTQDRVLDLWVTPDRAVTWKDEDELEIAVATGRWTMRDADLFRTDAREVESLVERCGPPFCDGWERWRPDPAWRIPDLPPHLPFDLDVGSVG